MTRALIRMWFLASLTVVAACGDEQASLDAAVDDAAVIDARIDAITADAAVDAVTDDAAVDAVTDAAAVDAITADAAVDAVTDASIDAVAIDAAVVPPTIAAVSPTRGSTLGGTVLTISGAGFVAGVTVTVDGSAASVQTVTATSVTAVTPARPGRAAPVDVVVTNPDTGQAIAVGAFRYFYGTVAFAAPLELPGVSEPRGLVATDLDGDGDVDVASAHRNLAVVPGVVTVHLGDGQGGFAAAVMHPVSSNLNSLAAGDFDRDGDVDLATAVIGDGGLGILRGTGGGGFATYSAADPSHRVDMAELLSVAAADVDGDGGSDLVRGFRGAPRGVGLYRSTAAGGWLNDPVVATTANVTVVAAARLDGDAIPDALGGIAGSVVVLRGTGGGGLAAPVAYAIGTVQAPLALATGDLDGDGDQDVVAGVFGGGAGLALLWNQGDGTFAPVVNVATAVNFSVGVALVDVDRDGWLDIVHSNLAVAGTISVRRNLGAGQFAPAVDFATGSRPRDLVAGDFNLDGRADLAVQHETDPGVSILMGTSQ